MRIPAWRIALTGGAVVILAVAGIGLASAAGVPATTPSQSAGAADPAIVGADVATRGAPDGLGLRAGLGSRAGLRALRHVVHGVLTLTDKNGDVVTIQLDQGTVTAVDGDSVTLSETGGTSVTIALADDTKVRDGRAPGSLDDIDVGDDLFVQSRVSGGSALARHIVILPAA